MSKFVPGGKPIFNTKPVNAPSVALRVNSFSIWTRDTVGSAVINVGSIKSASPFSYVPVSVILAGVLVTLLPGIRKLVSLVTK